MSKGKALFVSALMALLLAGLLWAAWRLLPRVFMGAALTLAVYGYWCGCCGFCRWLGDREALLPARSCRTWREDAPGSCPAVERWDWSGEEGL